MSDSEVTHESVIPEFVVYDNATGEFINKYTGVVLNRICFLRASGVVTEYPRDPKEMICGAMPRRDSEIAKMVGNSNLICTAKVGLDINSKRVVGHAGDHEDKHGYKWAHSESVGSK
jgi:hypothetical protein